MVQINRTVKYIRVNLDYFGMKFNKKLRVGVSILFLLLIFTTSISFIDFGQKNSIIDENSLSISPVPPDDAYETRDGYANNNEFYNATDITYWEWSWLSSLDGNGTQWDSDFYMIYIPMGYEHLRVNVTFWHFLGDINVRIWDDYWYLVVESTSVSDDEYIDTGALSYGYHYIEVIGSNTGNTYDLVWTTHPVDDPYEENDNWSSAVDISGDRGFSIFGIQHDEDWYKFTVIPGDKRLIIDLWFSHYEGDIDITLYDNTITSLAWSSSVDDNEFINYVLPVITLPTTYYILIYYGNQGNYYDLYFDMVPLDDPFEENDVWTNAFDISGYEYGSHFGIQADDDWYKTYVDWNETRLQVDLGHDDFLGHIEFEIFFYDGINPYNNPLEWTDGTWIHMNVIGGEWYYIHINGSNTGNQYDLSWNTVIPLEDNYEPNDRIGPEVEWLFFGASFLPNGLGVQFDEDWYGIRGIENHIYIETFFLFPLVNHNLEIWYIESPGVFVKLAGSSSTGHYLFIDVDLPGYGDYYILVNGPNYGIEYDLWWRLGEGDDYLEENDDFYNPEPIYPNYYPDLWIVNDDDDWFSIFLNSGDNIEVHIYFDHYEGDLELELYDPNYNNRIGSYSVDNEEKVIFTADITGDWRIRVFHAFGDTRVYYNLEIWVNGGGDDRYEENDLAADAYDLTSYEGLWIGGMQFDIDWFKFDIGEGVENLIVVLNYNDYEGDINIELIDNFSNIIGHSNDRTGNEQIEIANPLSGTYYIRIHGQGFENWYDLYWSSGGEVFYGDDFYEYNDDLDNAYGLWDDEQTWLSDIGGLAVQGNYDWYMIDVTPHFLNVIVELEFNYSQGEIHFELYNDIGNNIGVGVNTTTDRNLLVLNVTVGDWGEHYIQVWGNNAENEYDLWWDDLRTDFREDEYEENDNFINATDLIDREGDELQNYLGFGVQYDLDWFKIFIGPDQSLPFILIVEMFYDSAEGLMGFEVYDDELTRVVGNFTLEDNDFVAYRLRSNGTYYIKVFGDNSGNVYNLLWKTKEDIPIEEIPGYDILILLGSIFGVISIVVIKWKRSKFNRK